MLDRIEILLRFFISIRTLNLITKKNSFWIRNKAIKIKNKKDFRIHFNPNYMNKVTYEEE